MKINLLGYYGFHNIGDDLMLENLIDHFLTDQRIKRINVFCREVYYKERDRVKYLPLSKLSKLYKAWELFKNDHTIWGGGTCIFEAENNNGIFELLRMQRIVKKSSNKFAFLGIGIGELHSRNYISAAKELLDRSDYCYFRDNESMQKARTLAGNKEYCSGGDLVFLSNIKPVINNKEQITKISFSGHYDFKKYPIQLVAENLKLIIEKLKCKIYFLPCHTGSAFNDNEYHKQLVLDIDPSSYEICDWNTPEEYLNILNAMDFHIGIRLHSLVLSDMLGIPNCGIAYSPKIEYYLNKTQLLPVLRKIELGQDDLVKNIIKIKEQYSYPEDFIQMERNSAIDCLSRTFAYE